MGIWALYLTHWHAMFLYPSTVGSHVKATIPPQQTESEDQVTISAVLWSNSVF
jgi:hypothetical protein